MKSMNWLVGGVCLLALALPLCAQTAVVGNWYGVLQTPIGPMTLVFTINGGEGALRGEMESIDQRTKTPLTSVTVSEGRLEFTILASQISYTGSWIEIERQWSGVFRQGVQIPLTLRRGLPPARPRFEALDGVWRALVTRNGVDLRLLLRITTDKHGSIITLDSPDLGATNLPVLFSQDSQTVRFSVPASGARFEGTVSNDGATLNGIWTLPGQPEVTITFSRTTVAADTPPRSRPQTPRAPFPYREEEVRFSNSTAEGVTLAGTLTLPAGAGPFPAAVLLTGSGPQDRDETIQGHKPFAVLADHLARNGVAVLRYDDRGIGRSTGDFAAATSADFATDANAAVAFLRKRAEVDPKAIGFIGHSEGGMVASIAAVDNHDVGFLILLAGPGTNLMQLLLTQQRLLGMSQGLSEEDTDRAEPVLANIYASVAKSVDAEDARARVRALLTADTLAVLRIPEARRELLAQQLGSNWFRYFLQVDPPAFLSRIQVPVLALNGTLDLQVPADANLAAIRMALITAPDITIRKLEGLNHMFQTARSGAIGEYDDIQETFAPIALRVVAEWIHARFKPGI